MSRVVSSGDEEVSVFTPRPKNEVTDPFVKAPPKFSLGLRIWAEAFGVPIITFLLTYVCFAVDYLLQYFPTGNFYHAVDMAIQMWLPAADPSQSKKVLNAVLLAMSVMFGIMLSIIGLVLDMASSKFTKTNISNIFFRDKIVLGTIAYVVIANVTSFFIYASIGEEQTGAFVPRFSVIVSVLLVVTLLLGVIPFMNYLFIFLDAPLVVAKINTIGFNGLKEASQDRNGAHVGEHQRKAVESIEHLRDASYRSLRKRDKTISSLSIDGLCSFLIHYSKTKNDMFKHWHIVPRWMRYFYL